MKTEDVTDGHGRPEPSLADIAVPAPQRGHIQRWLERTDPWTTRVGVLLPRPLAARQGGALDPRRELHRVLLVEGVCQGRHHHLGDAADRLSVEGPDMPEYEPRGCPRGASFSWYTYSPLRIRYPYIRGVLLEMYREAKSRLHDPVDAWGDLVGDPERARGYKSVRGKGGFVRASWDEVAEIIAAAHIHTICRYGRDRVVGFSPIPAMSMVSYSAGTRFFSLIGGVILSFYDWYADLPAASPQIWGDQTDVPESGDWWNAGYFLVWGSNIPITRTPDAHFMTEARYRGQKVVVVSPDYSDHTRFADHWLPAAPGTDGALAMAMGHVILKEFWVEARCRTSRTTQSDSPTPLF